MRRKRGDDRRWWLGLIVVATIVAAATGGCAEDREVAADEADREAVVRVVGTLQQAFERGDRRDMCAQMDGTARRQAGLVAHGRLEACPKDLSEAFEVIDAGGGMSGVRSSKVAATTIDGNNARATLDLDGHGSVDVPLTRDGKRWRLATFFGTPPREAEATAVAGGVNAPLPGGGSPVAISEGGLPCFPILEDDYPEVGGGCTLGVFARRVTLTIGTAFGRFEFAECELGYTVATDGKGRAWTTSFDLSGPDNTNNGCADVRPCKNTKGERLPWRGRIVAGRRGGFVHRMNACLDTCIGFYSGEFAIRLQREGRTWRATADNAGVGRSGLRFDGAFELAPNRVELSRASRRRPQA